MSTIALLIPILITLAAVARVVSQRRLARARVGHRANRVRRGRDLSVISSLLCAAIALPFSLAGAGETDPDMDLRGALTAAMVDEYKARAMYREVIEEHGNVRPFSKIVEAESRHIEALSRLFDTHGIPVPADEVAGNGRGYATRQAACEAAAEAEVANAALYDRLLAATSSYPDVQETFRRLQSASQDRHLPAFQRCLEGGRGPGPHGGGHRH